MGLSLFLLHKNGALLLVVIKEGKSAGLNPQVCDELLSWKKSIRGRGTV